jgi:RNA polymerase sigma-70 factor (ECF subfamily)
MGGVTDRTAAKRDFTQAVEAQIDALYGLALRLVRNRADAEDLVAETVTKAWLAIDTLDDPDRFRPWIFRILRNQFISEHRKASTRPRLVSIDEQEDDAGETDVISLLNRQPDEFLQWWANPETDVANRLLGEQIMAAIEELPESFRETILLVNVDGLGYDEAAKVLGVPPGTIRSRMKRGRTLLQKALWVQARDAGLIRDQEKMK